MPYPQKLQARDVTHLQVIPFLVLAVGVDNMFILAHALQQQNPRLPIPERLGRALAGAGPSITLAAACEALAFGLGGLTSMPAVRNFSLCAAVAVLLDYALQVVALIPPVTIVCMHPPYHFLCPAVWWLSPQHASLLCYTHMWALILMLVMLCHQAWHQKGSLSWYVRQQQRAGQHRVQGVQ